jgi:hypothetical protein
VSLGAREVQDVAAIVSHLRQGGVAAAAAGVYGYGYTVGTR